MSAKKKAFTKYDEKWKQDDKSKTSIKRDMDRIKKYCQVVRVLACSQMSKLNLRQRKAHLMEIQINGGTVTQKVEWARGKLESEVTIGEVF